LCGTVDLLPKQHSPAAPRFPALNAASTDDRRAASINGNGQPPSPVTSTPPAPPFYLTFLLPLSAAFSLVLLYSPARRWPASICSPLPRDLQVDLLLHPPGTPALRSIRDGRRRTRRRDSCNNLHAFGSTRSSIVTPRIPVYFISWLPTLAGCSAFVHRLCAFRSMPTVSRGLTCA
jgi:hypothetical protein